jgi:hypothetical protein
MFAAALAPARGTPLSDLVPASIVALIAAAAVVALAVAHRQGRTQVLNRLGAVAERATGLPAWAGLPDALTTASLGVAVFGFYWDVSWHIDRGRDPGPFANPAHWLIIFGLAGIALAGVLAVTLGDDAPDEVAKFRLPWGWEAPVGSVLLAVCGLIALAGFPLDDVWHRLFGQDVTLWGPTHVQMVGGASLATLAMWSLGVQARRVQPPTDRKKTLHVRYGEMAAAGSFLIGMSTLQGEFDFGVPQFRLLYQPILIVLAASVALVAARIRIGKGGALGAAVMFIALRGALAVIIGPVLGRSILHFPLYLVEAAIVELVALRIPRDRQVTLGLVSGLGIGTIGLAAEFGWSHVWMPLPWPASLLPQAAVLGVLAGAAGGVIGGLIGRALAPSEVARQTAPSGLVAAAWVVALLCVSLPMPMTARTDLTAHAVLQDVEGGAGRHVRVIVDLNDPSAARHADWFNVTAWQGARTGDGGLVIAPFHRLPDGRYQTTTPIPVSGTWKSIIRLHAGRSLSVVPLYLPADPAIPVLGVQAYPTFTRHFERDKSVLQREAVGGTPGLQRAAYALLALVGLLWLGSLGAGLRRVGFGREGGRDSERELAVARG